ncbi:hypothetical protein FRB99_001078 [Tulasnella sp. 403]|nr:hypothetical protein FRB99_001078 [Tulasnella sp. 403]
MGSSLITETLRTAATAALGDFSRSLEEIDAVRKPLSMGHFVSTIRALNTFQRSIAALSARVARQRNLLLPIHQLPHDIFLRILQDVMECKEVGCHYGISKYHRMAKVSVHWRTAILSSPSLWRILKDYDDERMQDTVLRLNPSGPLIVLMIDHDKSMPEPFMAKVIPLSSRWQSFIFHRSYVDTLPDLLNNLPPTLKDLSVILRGRDISQTPVTITDGDSFRHVRFRGLAIPWDSSRLRDLQTLELDQICFNQPTISNIISILLSSPHLERLVLRKWEARNSIAHQDKMESKRCSNTFIPLRSLTTLILEFIPGCIIDFLLNHIKTTSLSCLILNHTRRGFGYDFDSAEPSSPFFDMIDQVLSQPCIKTTAMNYDDDKGRARIETNPRAVRSRTVIHWVEDAPGLDITFRARAGASCGPAWRLLAHKMTTHAPCLALDFVDRNLATMSLTPAEHTNVWGSERFPLALLPHLPRVERVEFTKGFYAGPVLRCLGTPRRGDEKTPWLCPELDTVEVRLGDDVQDDGEHDRIAGDILEFIGERYSPVLLPEWESISGDDDELLGSDDDGTQGEDIDGGGEDGNVNHESAVNSVSESESSRANHAPPRYSYPTMLSRLALPPRIIYKLEGMNDGGAYALMDYEIITSV